MKTNDTNKFIAIGFQSHVILVGIKTKPDSLEAPNYSLLWFKIKPQFEERYKKSSLNLQKVLAKKLLE